MAFQLHHNAQLLFVLSPPLNLSSLGHPTLQHDSPHVQCTHARTSVASNLSYLRNIHCILHRRASGSHRKNPTAACRQRKRRNSSKDISYGISSTHFVDIETKFSVCLVHNMLACVIRGASTLLNKLSVFVYIARYDEPSFSSPFGTIIYVYRGRWCMQVVPRGPESLRGWRMAFKAHDSRD